MAVNSHSAGPVLKMDLVEGLVENEIPGKRAMMGSIALT